MGSVAKSDQYRLLNMLEAAGEEIEEADDVDYNDHCMGVSRIGATLLTLVQSHALDMTSMVEKFLN